MNRKTPGKLQRVSGSPQSPKAQILIIEDDIDARLVMEEFLGSKGYTTTLAKTVDEGLALLESELEFDLVLLDLMLPGRDGMELLQTLRRKPAVANGSPVVIVSAFAPPVVDGAAAVLHKPIDLNLLQATIERVLAARAGASG